MTGAERVESTQAGEPGSLGERLLHAQHGLSDQTLTVEDRRKVIRVTVDGAQRVRAVELDSAWAKSVQSQKLQRDVFTLYVSARERATAAARAAHAAAGLGDECVAQVEASLRDAVALVPGAADLTGRLESETVRTERARGNVVAEFNLRGVLLSLEVRPRYAGEASPDRLASEICECLQEGEEAAGRRQSAILAEFAAARPFDAPEKRLEEFKQTLAELRARLR